MTSASVKRAGLVIAGLAAALLAACRGGAIGGPSGADPNRPISLDAGPQGVTGGPPLLVPVNRDLAERSIETYRINKKRAKGPYTLKGVDLDGDGVGEALVLFGGKDWCKSTGCSLTIFKAAERGYTPAFRTVSVKAPVIIAREQNQGWRDIIVMSGGGAPLRRVVLRFSGLGYPRNAMLEPEFPPGEPIEGQVAIGAPGAYAPSQASSMGTR